MKRLVIVGASGMVSGYSLRYALEHPSIECVMSVGRKRLGILHSRSVEILYPDFADCSALAEPVVPENSPCASDQTDAEPSHYAANRSYW